MLRSSIIIVVITLMLSNFQIGKVTSIFCKEIADIASIFHAGHKVMFFVYTNGNDGPQRIKCRDNCDLKKLQFNPNLRTTVIIPGFLSDYKRDWVQSLIKELFSWEDMNVIVADYSQIINTNYYQTAKKTDDVADQIFKLLLQVAKKTTKDLKNWPYLHFIGHSIGAHVAGQTARKLKEKVFVHRITAFDPAKPYFYEEGAHLRLDKSLAQFVDVIHTNSAPNEETLGMYEPLGHIDFYPNGGDRQPGCKTKIKSLKRTIDPFKCFSELIFGGDVIDLKKNYLSRIVNGDDMVCDHAKGQEYFIKSINGGSKFIARKVKSISKNENTVCASDSCTGSVCVEMGMNAFRYNDLRNHGKYYVNTECDAAQLH